VVVTPPPAGLGTLLRHLLELLDGDLEHIYKQAGLIHRPKYTPILRVLIHSGPSAIQDIARQAVITHSAASQTVSEMVRNEFLYLEPGVDGRRRIVHMSARTRQMLPKLRRIWAATNAAASELNAELLLPLDQILTEAIDALHRRPFASRIASSSAKATTRQKKQEKKRSA
jgi:DNA-binding MarR family transcriptional regulator